MDNRGGILSAVQVHPLADVQTVNIGQGTRIWQFCVVFEGAIIGQNCNICAHVLIESDVVLGNNVTVKSGVQLWDGLRVEDDVFIGPNVTFTNDPYPRSKVYSSAFLPTMIAKGASIGGGAVILPGVTIGAGSMVGAGAVVSKSVPPHTIVVGNPARVVGNTRDQG
ncbi:N-acetyltransferase [Cryobacterium breve]|uniref:N-acetyltransferase n=2 Tax=Cryobacterium TaxID=69578 RepID=A0ABY2IZ12_9MICO|nr:MULTISPECIES: acyltransferase [Cryobacterium]TFC93281.1 N-acetyltransferase [Cryobacterium sp. TmT3-12]TFC97863.1 N-acetyltransferase [Cryobacterium breve]